MPRQQQLFRILMSDGMRLARDGRINLLERMGSSRPRLQKVMRGLIAQGCLRDADPELLVMQFIGPLLFWRQLHAIGADDRRHPQPPRVRPRPRRSVSQRRWRRRRTVGSPAAVDAAVSAHGACVHVANPQGAS